MSASATAPYELMYWPGIPGRAEHIRLLLEAAQVAYTDHSVAAAGASLVLSHISGKNTGTALNPPPFAPPILKHGDLLIHQTSNILLYLGPKHGLAPAFPSPPAVADTGPAVEDDGLFHVNQLALMALDGLGNEAHDTHHPVATGLYYEDQKPEAKRAAEHYRNVRLPKFLGFFERVLAGERSGGGEWLYGGRMTYADLVLFQCLDGLKFAFPKTLRKLEEGGEYAKVFGLYGRVKEVKSVKAYLDSDRRKGYSNGIYRHYPELEEDLD